MHIFLFGTDMNLWAQIIDLIGFIIIGVAYFQKKYGYIITCIFAYICFIAESIVIMAMDGTNTWANIIGTTSGVIRNLFMLYYAKKWNKEVPTWIAVVILIITWCCNIPFFDSWFTYIPCIALTVCTLTAVQKNYYILKTGAVFNEAANGVYYFVVGGYFGAVRELILTLIIGISMITLFFQQRKEAKSKQTSTENTQIDDSQK
jgi:uncharacterized membrane protein